MWAAEAKDRKYREEKGKGFWMISLRTGSKCTFETTCCLCQNHLARFLKIICYKKPESSADYNDLAPMVFMVIRSLAMPQECEFLLKFMSNICKFDKYWSFLVGLKTNLFSWPVWSFCKTGQKNQEIVHKTELELTEYGAYGIFYEYTVNLNHRTYSLFSHDSVVEETKNGGKNQSA